MINKKEIFIGGKHTVFETIKLNSSIINYIVCVEKNYLEISNLLKNFNKSIKIQIWNVKKIDNIFDQKFAHQNYACSINGNVFKNYKDLKQNTKEIVIFEEMYDFRNVGAMIRSGLAFGIKDFFFNKKNTTEKFDQIFKTSSGYVASVNIYKYSNLSSLIKSLKAFDFWFFGLDGGKDSQSIYEMNWPNKTAIIIGNESFGLKKFTKSNCDYLIRIPISKDVESLNVSSAFAIAMAIKKRPQN